MSEPNGGRTTGKPLMPNSYDTAYTVRDDIPVMELGLRNPYGAGVTLHLDEDMAFTLAMELLAFYKQVRQP